MSDSQKYTGQAMDRRYSGEDVDITYSVKRCIHAKHCVNHLSQVFDTDKRPWINPDGAPAGDVARVIMTCPSGALHFIRKDGGPAETAPDTNSVILWADGPLQFIGDLSIQGAQTAVDDETRATLCRCGASTNKPFCDNSHKDSGFTAADPEPAESFAMLMDASGRLTITATANGPLHVEGPVTITTQDGRILYTGDETWLCRCGGSSSKPFCDGTHNHNGFSAE